MHYQNKYLKYKNRYVYLKNQLGGTFNTQINLVISNDDRKKELVNIDRVSNNIFQNTIVQSNEESNVKFINENAIYLYKNFVLENFVALYDNIGALYICSKITQKCWNDLATEIGLNIAIFNGDNSSCKNISPKNYIIGINIIAGCSTRDHATKLNKDYNKIGKYFIGFDGYKHNYGTSFYLCPRSLIITAEEFKLEYDKLLSEIPIIKIIKIFYNKFKHCKNVECRNCNIITLNKIKDKLKILKNKIDKRESFNNSTDNYFNSDYHINCDNDLCNPDLYFEEYIRDIYLKENQKLLIKEKELEKEKEFKKIKNQIITCNTDNSDITNDYIYFINDNIIDAYFDQKNIILKNNYLQDNKFKFLYKLFLKKSRNNNSYFNIIKYNTNHDEVDSIFYDCITNNIVDEYGIIDDDDHHHHDDHH